MAMTYDECSLVPRRPTTTNAEIMEELNRARRPEMETNMIPGSGTLMKQTTDSSLQDKIRFLAESNWGEGDCGSDRVGDLTREESFEIAKYAGTLRELVGDPRSQEEPGSNQPHSSNEDLIPAHGGSSLFRTVPSGFGSADHKEMLHHLTHGGMTKAISFGPEDLPPKLYDIIAPNLHHGNTIRTLVSDGPAVVCNKPQGLGEGYGNAGFIASSLGMDFATSQGLQHCGQQIPNYLPNSGLSNNAYDNSMVHRTSPYETCGFGQSMPFMAHQPENAHGGVQRSAQLAIGSAPLPGVDGMLLDSQTLQSTPLGCLTGSGSHPLTMTSSQGYGQDLMSCAGVHHSSGSLTVDALSGSLSSDMDNFIPPSHNGGLATWPAASSPHLHSSNGYQSGPDLPMSQIPNSVLSSTPCEGQQTHMSVDIVQNQSQPTYGGYLCGSLMDMKPYQGGMIGKSSAEQGEATVGSKPSPLSVDCLSGQSSSSGTLGSGNSSAGHRLRRRCGMSDESIEMTMDNPRKVLRKNTAGEGSPGHHGSRHDDPGTEVEETQGSRGLSDLQREACHAGGVKAIGGASVEECLALLHGGLGSSEEVDHLLSHAGPGPMDDALEAELQTVDFDLRVQRAEKKIKEHNANVQRIDAMFAAGELDKEEAKSMRRQAYNRREAAASRARKDRELRHVVMQKQKLEKIEKLLRNFLATSLAENKQQQGIKHQPEGLRRVSSGNDLETIALRSEGQQQPHWVM